MMSPAEFIPIAEETGLINQLGDRVLTTACNEAATGPDGIKLAVNVSPIQFKSATLALRVIAALAASGIAPSGLELEITEAVLIRDDAAALTTLHQLRAIGVLIALDDFGTGYSSLRYLQRFAFDKINIARSFICDVAQPVDSSAIIQAVVNIARSRGMTTTAEGVETKEQLNAIQRARLHSNARLFIQCSSSCLRYTGGYCLGSKRLVRAREETPSVSVNAAMKCSSALQARQIAQV